MADGCASQFIVVYHTAGSAGEVKAVGPYRKWLRAQEACDRMTVIHDESDFAGMFPPSVLRLNSEHDAAQQIRDGY